jgi:cyclic-di-AMP phosphodiesterase PgpH
MSPLIKKALFRIKKLDRPFLSEKKQRNKLLAKSFLRAGIILSTLLIVIGVIFSSRFSARFLLNEGDIASEDIYAPFDFSYVSGTDEQKTKNAQARALSRVLDVYNIDPGVFNEAARKTEAFFDALDKLKGVEPLDEEEALAYTASLKGATGLEIKKEDIEALLNNPDTALLKKQSLQALDSVLAAPVISKEESDRLTKESKKAITIYDDREKTRKDIDIDQAGTRASANKMLEAIISEFEGADRNTKSVLFRVLSSFISPNLVYNKTETELLKRQAVSLVEPYYITDQRLKGEAIIRKGQRIGKAHTVQLDVISSKAAPADTYLQLFGVSMLTGIILFAMYVFLRIFEFKIYSQEKFLILIGLFVILTSALARVVALSPLPSLFLPVASAAMLLTLLIGGIAASIVLVVLSSIASLVAGVQFNVLLVSFIGGITAICAVHNARSRSDIIRAGFYVGIMNFVVIAALGIISNFDTSVYIRQGLWGLASGIVSAAITMIALPAFEWMFKITTDIKLLELADLNHPLLKDMVTKATGTYHHSINVGNLAEAASEAIDANSLLCRIGAYYHDIGKIEKSEYFAENQQTPLEIHKGLSPSMSSLVISNHVKDGEELAEKYKLGNAIKDIIKQHHGTGLITYFYHQALEKKKQGEAVSEDSFRYPGPKPQSKESAIVMLADSVEAASRVLQNPTPGRLKELVRKIINNKFLDRQLDECELTLNDISKISESFVKILTATYHSRVEYPDLKQAGNENKSSK